MTLSGQPASEAARSARSWLPAWLRPRNALLLLIRLYQVSFGLLVPPGTCRFHPTCSRYAYQAIQRHGSLRGTWLAARRLARCQPFGGSGYDPVPD